MQNTFSEVKLFQVKPDKVEEFERLIVGVAAEQGLRPGCLGIKYVKRGYIFDDVMQPPREFTRVVKCVKYYSYWEFDTMEHYADATRWLFEEHAKALFKLLIMPFDINCGHTLC